MLAPLGWLYGLGAAMRREAYARGAFRPGRLVSPVISVGGLAMGGSMKTSLVIEIARALQDRGGEVGIIGHGYRGRVAAARLVSDGHALLETAHSVGDEAVLLSTDLKRCPVVVGRNKYKAGRLLETKFGRRILIVDGGGELFKIVELNQIDCNGNGTADTCDLASGNSLDVNINGIPDECEGAPPFAFCSGKFTAGGCAPTMAFTGYSSATKGFGFIVKGNGSINNKNGLLLYSINGPASTPFQGGVLCVNTPIKRTPGVNSGGSPAPADDCTGVFAIDFNAFAVGALGGTPLAALQIPGTNVTAQWWGRDPGYPAPNNSQLANGLQFQVCP